MAMSVFPAQKLDPKEAAAKNNGQDGQEAQFAAENLSGLSAALFMAEKMGKRLGKREILFG